MKRRVFVATPIPEEIQEKIIKWQGDHANFVVRWIKPENLHITLVPPWYVTEDELQQMILILEKISKTTEPFEVNFDKILLGPPGQPPRLIWAEGKTSEEFTRLKGLAEEMLLDASTGFFAKEKRPAKLHLTLARFRPENFKKPSELREEIDWSFELQEINFMESELKRTGAEYTVITKLQI